MKILCWTALLALALSAASGTRLSPKDFEQAKKMTKGTFHLRVDAPCIYTGFGGMYGPSYTATSVVVASPSASNVDLDVAGRLTVSGATWVLGPNDPVGNGKLYYTRIGDLEFDFEGLGAAPKNQESIVTFREINSPEDFQKAFDRIFSRVPLEDAHSEWPAEVRKAVAEHRLIEGMDRQQVHAVIGAPASVETDRSEGRVVEKWYSRLAGGVVPGVRRRQSPPRFPRLIVFLNGKLTTAEAFYAPDEREALLQFGRLPSKKK